MKQNFTVRGLLNHIYEEVTWQKSSFKEHLDKGDLTYAECNILSLKTYQDTIVTIMLFCGMNGYNKTEKELKNYYAYLESLIFKLKNNIEEAKDELDKD